MPEFDMAVRYRALLDFQAIRSEPTMNRRTIFGFPLATALGLTLLLGNAFAQEKTLKEQILGTWTAVSWMQVNKDGSTFQRFGSYPKGVSVFGADGRFFVMYARPDLRKIESGSPMKATPDENRTIMEGSIAYFGTFSVDEPTKSITLSIETSTFPNQNGSEQKWIVTSVTANELKLSNPAASSGNMINYVMRRASTFASK